MLLLHCSHVKWLQVWCFGQLFFIESSVYFENLRRRVSLIYHLRSIETKFLNRAIYSLIQLIRWNLIYVLILLKVVLTSFWGYANSSFISFWLLALAFTTLVRLLLVHDDVIYYIEVVVYQPAITMKGTCGWSKNLRSPYIVITCKWWLSLTCWGTLSLSRRTSHWLIIVSLIKTHVIIISSHVSVVMHEVVLEEVVVVGVLDIRIISNSKIASRCVVVCLISLLIKFFDHILLVDTVVWKIIIISLELIWIARQVINGRSLNRYDSSD